MVTKKGAGKSKAAGAGSEAAGGGSKAAGGGSEASGSGSKASGGGSKASGSGSEASGGGSKASDGGSVIGVEKASVFERVELKAPTRTGRSLKNMGNALEEFEFRLRVTEKYLAVLKPALPGGDGFLSVGWSAVGVLRAAPGEVGDGSSARAARTVMVEVAGVVREIVVRTTRVGDVAREAVLVGEELNAKVFGSVDQCGRILKGAKEHQGSFAALTDDLLKELAAAIDLAATASGTRKDERTTTAVERLSESDAKQLAVDVLLDCADQLGSAALSTMRSTHPNVVERLCRALEPSGGDGESGGTPPPA